MNPPQGERRRSWDWLLANIRIRELFALVGSVVVAISIFLPWIYGFSAPSGPSNQVTLVAAPDLFGLAFRSNYPYLLVVLPALAFGLAFALTPIGTRKLLKVATVGVAFVVCEVANFVFGLQFGSAIGLVMDGSYVSYSITLGLGSRLLGLGTFMYLVSLFITIVVE